MTYAPRQRIQASVRQVQEAVADYYGFSLGELLGRSRARQLTAPRHLSMYLAREITAASLPALGVGVTAPGLDLLVADQGGDDQGASTRSPAPPGFGAGRNVPERQILWHPPRGTGRQPVYTSEQ